MLRAGQENSVELFLDEADVQKHRGIALCKKTKMQPKSQKSSMQRDVHYKNEEGQKQ